MAIQLELYYHTLWNPCMCHCMTDGDTIWEDKLMQSCDSVGRAEWKKLKVCFASSLSFVMCNGDKTLWDNPPPWKNTQNYSICREDICIQEKCASHLGSVNNLHEASADTKPPVVVKYTLVDGELTYIEGKPILLVCDLDGTLVGHSEYLKLFKQHWLKHHVWRESLLVYNTGRNLKSALMCAHDEGLLLPDYFICGVGTEIYFFTAPHKTDDGVPLPTLYQCDLDTLANNVALSDWKFPSWCPSALHARLDKEWLKLMISEFSRKEVEEHIHKTYEHVYINGTCFYDPLRISLSVPCDVLVIDAILKYFTGQNMKVLISGGGHWRYIDILPPSGGKLWPVIHLVKKLHFAPSQVLLCGDSGNDLDMFCHPEFMCCCVSNASTELLSVLKKHKNFEPLQSILNDSWIQSIMQNQTFSPPQHIWIANHPFASGILEALQHFGFDHTIPVL